MDIGQEDVARGTNIAHFVLHMQSKLKIVTPVVTAHAIVGEYRIINEEDS